MSHKEVGEKTVENNYANYGHNRFIVGFKTEKMGKGGQAFTGISTKAGDLVTVRSKPSSQPTDLDAGTLIRCSTSYRITQGWRLWIQELRYWNDVIEEKPVKHGQHNRRKWRRLYLKYVSDLECLFRR